MTLELDQSQTEEMRSTQGTEHLLSRLVMGFVERNISPHTIADVVRAQVLDAHVPPTVLSPTTCNGVIEIVASASQSPSDLETLLFLALRPDFPEFLSPKAAAGLILYFLKQINTSETRYFDPSRKHRINAAIEQAARRAISTGYFAQASFGERNRILNTIKSLSPEVRTLLGAEAPTLELLRQGCAAEPTAQNIVPRVLTSMNMTPEEILRAILTLPDHTLAQKGIVHFRGQSHEALIAWRVTARDRIMNELEATTLSHFKRSFLTEWYFDGMLRETLNREALTETLYRNIEGFLARFGNDDAIPKGILRALQHDLSLAATEFNYPDSKSARVETLLSRANHLAVLLLPVATANIQLFSRQFAAWALQTPVHPAEVRIFTRSSWQWMRVLISGSWEDDLKVPPVWVVGHSSRFCAQIFRIAPAFWLQEHATQLVERLLAESSGPRFETSPQQVDYVEFLCRTLRKKSPIYASRSELLLALNYLGRSTPQEQAQLSLARTRARMSGGAERALTEAERQFWQTILSFEENPEQFGANCVTRALNVLLFTSRLIARSMPRASSRMGG